MANSSDEEINSDNEVIDLRPLWRNRPFLTDLTSDEDEEENSATGDAEDLGSPRLILTPINTSESRDEMGSLESLMARMNITGATARTIRQQLIDLNTESDDSPTYTPPQSTWTRAPPVISPFLEENNETSLRRIIHPFVGEETDTSSRRLNSFTVEDTELRPRRIRERHLRRNINPFNEEDGRASTRRTNPFADEEPPRSLRRVNPFVIDDPEMPTRQITEMSSLRSVRALDTEERAPLRAISPFMAQERRPRRIVSPFVNEPKRPRRVDQLRAAGLTPSPPIWMPRWRQQQMAQLASGIRIDDENDDGNQNRFVLPAALAELEKENELDEATRAERSVFISELIYSTLMERRPTRANVARKLFSTSPKTKDPEKDKKDNIPEKDTKNKDLEENSKQKHLGE